MRNAADEFISIDDLRQRLAGFALVHIALVIDIDREVVELDGYRVNLTLTETAFFLYLARSAGRAVPRDELSQALWNDRADHDERQRVLVARIRRKLARMEHVLKTHRGYGYSLQLDAAVTLLPAST